MASLQIHRVGVDAYAESTIAEVADGTAQAQPHAGQVMSLYQPPISLTLSCRSEQRGPARCIPKQLCGVERVGFKRYELPHRWEAGLFASSDDRLQKRNGIATAERVKHRVVREGCLNDGATTACRFGCEHRSNKQPQGILVGPVVRSENPDVWIDNDHKVHRSETSEVAFGPHGDPAT